MKKLVVFAAVLAIAGSLQAQTLADYANAGDAAMANEEF